MWIWKEYEENMKRIRSEYEEDMKEMWKEYAENMKRIGSEYEEVMIRELKLTLEFMKTKYIWEKVKITCETDHCWHFVDNSFQSELKRNFVDKCDHCGHSPEAPGWLLSLPESKTIC